MKAIAAKEAKNNFGELMDNAQREPITIERRGRAVAVIMSAKEYEKIKLERLRAKLAIGEAQADRGEFSNKSVKEIISEAKAERATK
ncbi:MAG: type II toxin-antitoxin system Phd/YefM family antitoxin [Gammaproteobacteria bacterium]|nr:type II toxin-antitoxin system Phd/YefM family antitoxin [Gammaproteobacteria bacterium]